MTASRQHARWARAAPLLALFAAYFITARLGLMLGAVSGFATLVWPPTGIALFALLRAGPGLWPAIFAAAFVTNFITGASLPVALTIGCGNTLAVVLAATALRRVGFDQSLGRIRDVVALLVFAALASPVVSATVGVGSLYAGNVVAPEALVATWTAWWLGDGLGMLTVCPPLLVWAHRASETWSPRKTAEAALSLAVFGGLAVLVFGRSAGTDQHWPYFVFPSLCWVSVRFTQRGAVAAGLLLSTIAVTETSLGSGPFARAELSESLFLVQLFMAISQMTGLLLAAAVSERDLARAVAEASLSGSRFLAQASASLAASLDRETTLRTVARLAIPTLGDLCLIDLVAGGGLERAAEVAATPEKDPSLLRLRQFVPTRERLSPIFEVLQTGRSLTLDEAGLERVRADAPEELRALLGALGLRSLLTVPLVARGEVLGLMTFAMAESGRSHTGEHLALAEELGRRAGVALDNVFQAERLAEASRLREDFLADAGHELRTPLTVLLLAVESIERAMTHAESEDKVLDRLARAKSAGFRLGKLIDQMLDVSRIAAGRLHIEPERMELEALLREIVDRMGTQAESSGSTLTITSEGPVVGHWDRLRLDQVLSNLLSNAIKYGDARPIDVSIAREQDWVVVRVRDRGIGIPAEAQQRLFGRFERAVGERAFGGLGLGLWICKQIVEASGGTIGLTSEAGRGSTFTVRLPLAVAAARPAGELAAGG